MFWRWEYVALYIIQTEINYLAGLFIDKSESKRKKIIWLMLAIISTLSILFSLNILTSSIIR